MSEPVAISNSPDIVQQGMKMAYDGVVDDPLPPWMISAITSSKRRLIINGALFAGMLALGVLLGVGIKSLTSSSESVVVAELGASDLGAQVHGLFTLDPVDPVQITAEDPAFLNLWVSHRLGRVFHLPDLSIVGFRALGARIVQDGNRAAALNVFQDDDKNRISLLVRANRAPVASAEVTFSKSADLKRLEWQQDDLVYALVGNSEKDELELLKSTIQR